MEEAKKMNKTNLIIIISIIGITCALVYTFGDNGLYALLALIFGLGKNKKKAEALNVEADEHIEIVDELVNEAVEHQQEAKKIYNDITEIIDTPVDYVKPIDEVVKNAKKDWS
jgi:hypothetical protein